MYPKKRPEKGKLIDIFSHNPLVKGGQGRSAQQTKEDTISGAIVWTVFIAVFLVVLIIAAA